MTFLALAGKCVVGNAALIPVFVPGFETSAALASSDASAAVPSEKPVLAKNLSLVLYTNSVFARPVRTFE